MMKPMTDPNNIPQEAKQLQEDMASTDEKTSKRAKADVASTDFDKEYDIAQDNGNGSGTQSSDPNPVNRKDASEGGSARSAGGSDSTGKVDNVDSPGDSDPDDYLDMAKDITKNVEADK